MPGRKRRGSIRQKLNTVVIGGIAITSFLTMIFSAWHYFGGASDARQRQFLQTAEVFAMVVSEPLAQGEQGRVARGLAAISRLSNFSYARVVDMQGRLVAELGSGVVLLSDGYVPLVLRSNLQVVADVVYGGERIGQLMLVGDNTDLRREVVQSFVIIFVSALLSSLIGVFFAGRMQRHLTMPIVQLSQAMQRIRETKDFSHTVASYSDDETGELVEAFNEMQYHIRQRDRRLAQYSEDLERTVEQRTSELVTARDAAEQANAAKSDFLATMSHEIRTPMNGMLVMAELLASASLSSQNRRYADVIVKSGHSLLGIINDILDFSKIESGKLELEQVAFSPAAVVEDVLVLFSERAAVKGLQLAGHAAADVPEQLMGDSVRLAQVLTNLVNNALKFTLEGGVFIELRLVEGAPGAVGSRLVFEVIDTGVGIAADKLTSIFDAFSQADQSTTRRFGGTGLGLAICKRLVAAMDGAIDVQSTPGEGSRFSFEVELTEVADTAVRALPLCENLRRALLVSDGRTNDQALVAYLGDHDIQPLVLDMSQFSEHALGEVDVVFARAEPLADIGLLAEMHEQRARPYLVCIAPIGDDGYEDLLRADVADDVIARPLTRSEFDALIHRLDEGRPRRSAALDDVASATQQDRLFTGARVLVADDSPVNREVAAEALKRLGITCEMVEDGSQAVDAVGRRSFDAVLMDCSMPVMDGFSATREIRQRELDGGGARLPVIALTAHVAGTPADNWQQAGMDAYLTKPFRLAELSEVLGRFLVAADIAPSPAADERNEPVQPAAAATGPKPVAANGSPVLDDAVLASLAEFQDDGGAELIGRLFDLFTEHAPAAFAEIERRIVEADRSALAAAAHALKSMGRNIGAVRMCAACERLELAAREGRPIAVDETLAAISEELERVRDVIEERRAA